MHRLTSTNRDKNHIIFYVHNLLTLMVYYFHFGWNKKGLTPLTVITNIIKHNQAWWKQDKIGVNQHLQWFTAKNKNRETASCPRVRTKINLILEFKNTFWHHLHKKVICDLPERVWARVCTHVRVCVCVCVCEREQQRSRISQRTHFVPPARPSCSSWLRLPDGAPLERKGRKTVLMYV